MLSFFVKLARLDFYLVGTLYLTLFSDVPFLHFYGTHLFKAQFLKRITDQGLISHLYSAACVVTTYFNDMFCPLDRSQKAGVRMKEIKTELDILLKDQQLLSFDISYNIEIIHHIAITIIL